MKIIEKISEDTVIATFLQAEASSHRWQKQIHEVLAQLQIEKSILDHPDLKNNYENKKRREVLRLFRGFGDNKFLFEQFPSNVGWVRVLLTKEDLKKVLYMNWEYWRENTDGTRNPEIFISHVKNKSVTFDTKIQSILSLSKQLEKGIIFSPLILVGRNENSPFVLLEGHFRLTAMLLALKSLPKFMESIIGFSEEIPLWKYY